MQEEALEALRDTAHQERRAISTPAGSQLPYRGLLDRLPAGAYTCDADGVITYFNQHAVEIWGRAPRPNNPADRFCGWLKFFGTDGSPIAPDQSWMALALRQGEECSGQEMVIERPDGRRLTVLAQASPIRDEMGGNLGAVNILLDISDRKRAEEDLKEADRSKDEFLAMLGHELRNPLAPIRTALQILHLKDSRSPDEQWAVTAIDRQVRQMTRLIDDLLDIARITGKKLELRKEPVELAEVLSAALETCRPLISEHGQELAASMPPEPIILEGDRTRLAQVIANLLNNAAKYTERGGHIWLTAERQGSEAVVKVRDTGVGISTEKLPSIFEMFAQVRQAKRPVDRPQDGLGVGLTLARQLVEMHGGTIVAASDGPGRGSEFIVRLPIAGEPSQAQRRAAAPPGRDAAASSLRILVVDDDRDSAIGLGKLLRIMGNDIRTAHDGLEAAAAADEFRPDVVLLDLSLPKMDGYEVARQIRQQPWGERIYLIATTGWGQEADRHRTKEEGFDHHMVKPIEPSALLQILASLDYSVRAKECAA